MPDASSITALLGPTNTGKTHAAIECMLSHDSGMIGLPLRLLAREVYDRVTARVGETRVALVTGEEKRVPRHPDYWVCTVEAMPPDLDVDFVAVDEVQLAAHPQRGHVFTQRLLGARGRRETYLLGSGAMRGIVADLVPTARLEERPRLSNLGFAGPAKLSKLPARSAVVAFSTPHVYELAERLRALRGGVAVVLGALSPRTRNAQVAMFQSGEVDVLVATDAIGMGLNLDVDHVAFASLRKFDGREVRGLHPSELAQIAGRAGRHRNDGTFGSVAPLVLPPATAADIELHRFDPVRRLVWRNDDLDFDSIDALLASLHAPPRARSDRLRRGPPQDDVQALALLAAMPAVRARVHAQADVRRLWDVCTVPDFRKLSVEYHAALLASLFDELSSARGSLDESRLEARVREIDDTEGDLDALLGRIASIRTWTYVAHRAGWVPHAHTWQERTREVEDRLSDALHARLVARFVEHGRTRRSAGTARPRGRAAATPVSRAVADEAVVPTRGHPFASLAALRAQLGPPPEAPGLADAPDAWVEAAIDAPHEAFGIDPRGRILHEGRALARLARGARLVLPDVVLLDAGALRAGTRSRLERRLVAFARDVVTELLAPLRAAMATEPPSAARELLYRLEQGLGTARAYDLSPSIVPADRARIERIARVKIGQCVAYAPALSRPAAVVRRIALCQAFHGPEAVSPVPRAGAVSLRVRNDVLPEAYTAIGYPVFAGRAVRADIAERVFVALRSAPDTPLAQIAAWLGCTPREASRIAQVIATGESIEPDVP